MKERWVNIKGYEKFYQISNFGKIKRLPHYIKTTNQHKVHKRFYKEKILKLSNDKDGYKLVTLKNKTYKVHRLVAQHFLKNIKNMPQVNHKDKNKSNNNVCNLEWCFDYENQAHAIRCDKKPRGITLTRSNTWQVVISYQGERYYLGRYKNKDIAYKIWYDKYIELRGVTPW